MSERVRGLTGAGMRRRGEGVCKAILAPSGVVHITGGKQAVEEAVTALCGPIDGGKPLGYTMGPGAETGVLEESE